MARIARSNGATARNASAEKVGQAPIVPVGDQRPSNTAITAPSNCVRALTPYDTSGLRIAAASRFATVRGRAPRHCGELRIAAASRFATVSIAAPSMLRSCGLRPLLDLLQWSGR